MEEKFLSRTKRGRRRKVRRGKKELVTILYSLSLFPFLSLTSVTGTRMNYLLFYDSWPKYRRKFLPVESIPQEMAKKRHSVAHTSVRTGANGRFVPIRLADTAKNYHLAPSAKHTRDSPSKAPTTWRSFTRDQNPDPHAPR